MNKKKYMGVSLFIVMGIIMIMKPPKISKIVDIKKDSGRESKFAIHLETTKGTYTEDKVTEFPTSGYILNLEKTTCYDYNDKPLDQKPIAQALDGKISLEANAAIYCDIYFQKDEDVPVVTKFSITGKDQNNTELNNGYSYKSDVKYTIEWNDNDVVYYCLTNNQSTCDKSWVETKGEKSISITDGTLTPNE